MQLSSKGNGTRWSAQNKGWELVGIHSKQEHYYRLSLAFHWKCTVTTKLDLAQSYTKKVSPQQKVKEQYSS